MIGKGMEQAFNDQVREEMYSFYLYLSMSAHFEALQYKGLAKWMRVQADEEMGHAMKFFEQLNERGGSVTLQAIKKPQASWKSALAVFAAAAEHERFITSRIHALVDQASAEKDHASIEFLQWFVKEQVEEEAALDPIVEQLKRIGDSVGGLYYLDHRLGKRGKE